MPFFNSHEDLIRYQQEGDPTGAVTEGDKRNAPDAGSESLTARRTILDRVNCLLTFDQTGQDCEEAMALMRRHGITADECNARRASTERPFYRPVQ